MIVAEKMGGATMYEMVRVGSYQILGEIIGLEGDNAIIHLFEEAGQLIFKYDLLVVIKNMIFL